MNYYAGIDVSLEWSSACVVDGAGKIVGESKVLSEPDALIDFFRKLGFPNAWACPSKVSTDSILIGLR